MVIWILASRVSCAITDGNWSLGPICKLRLAGDDKVFVQGYELANELCSRSDFVKFPATAVRELKNVTPEGIFTADHDDWFWGPAHRVLVPALGPMAIKKMFPGEALTSRQLFL